MGDLSDIFGGSFNPDEHKEASLEPIPPGKYTVTIEESRLVPTKAGTGAYIELKLRVIGGPHAGRKVIGRLNIDNPSAKCREIGCGQLTSVCRALRRSKIDDTAELLNGVLDVYVKVEGAYNTVTSYSKNGEVSELPQEAVAQPQQPIAGKVPQQANDDAPVEEELPKTLTPWERQTAA